MEKFISFCESLEKCSKLLMDGKMRGKYLGKCLNIFEYREDNISRINPIINSKKIVYFVQNWMNQNKENFKNLWNKEKIEEVYKKFELPRINHETCPRDKNHSETIKDLGGRVRCAYTSREYLKPSFVKSSKFFDNLSDMVRTEFFEEEPGDDGENKNRIFVANLVGDHLEILCEPELLEYLDEEPSLEMINSCYAIISEKERVLPLETILKRLNLGVRRKRDEKPVFNEEIRFLPNAKDLAFYVQKWYQQLQGDKIPPFFENEHLSRTKCEISNLGS